MDALMGLLGGPLFAVSNYSAPADVRKFARFVALMGFSAEMDLPCEDGVSRPLFVRWE